MNRNRPAQPYPRILTELDDLKLALNKARRAQVGSIHSPKEVELQEALQGFALEVLGIMDVLDDLRSEVLHGCPMSELPKRVKK